MLIVFLAVLVSPQSIDLVPTSNSMHVSWTEPLAGGGATAISVYVVTYSAAGDDDNTLDVYEGTEAIIDGLVPNTLYTVTVAARASDGRIGDSLTACSSSCKYSTSIRHNVVLGDDTKRQNY